MVKLKAFNRIEEIEKIWDAPIENLLYQMHWGEDMMHREIGKMLDLPRPTITRWFAQLHIPTQSCRRFTDKNLTSWLYKTGKLKKKPSYNGPDRRIQRTKGNVNIDFFKKWSSQMAYVLGFFAADGGMFINSGGSKYIQFTSTDKEILLKIRRLVSASHKIGVKKRYPGNLGWKKCYLIQIGSKEMYDDLLKLGFTPKKDIKLKFPKVPNKYLNHFVRGYFDGDGFITCGWYNRKNRNKKQYFYFQAGFTCGTRKFLEDLSNGLNVLVEMKGGSIRSKPRSWDLFYGRRNVLRLFRYMYTRVASNMYLGRKYNKFQEGMKIWGRSVAGLTQ